MKKEYALVAIIGLFVSAYVLEAIVQPLSLDLATPYHYIDPVTLRTYPFTTTIIIIRALAILMIPPLVMSLIDRNYTLKAGVSFLLAGLSQLYVLQEIATGNAIIPLEWSLSIALAGVSMLIFMVIYLLKSMVLGAHKTLTGKNKDYSEEVEEETEE